MLWGSVCVCVKHRACLFGRVQLCICRGGGRRQSLCVCVSEGVNACVCVCVWVAAAEANSQQYWPWHGVSGSSSSILLWQQLR